MLAFALAWALGAAAWVGLAVLACGGWDPLMELDPLAPSVGVGQVETATGPALVWMGDSVCGSRAGWDAADMKVPPLGTLMEQRLCGRGGPAQGWAFINRCAPGNKAWIFEAEALAFSRQALPPRLAVIPVNLRSLNLAGVNGFGLGAPLTLGQVLRSRQGPQTATVLHALGTPGSALLALSAWGRGALQTMLEPVRLADAVAPPPAPRRAALPSAAKRSAVPAPATPSKGAPSAQETFDGQARVYGQGYELDEAGVEALLNAGKLLRAKGCRVLYYLTPAERRRLAAQLGEGVLAQRDAAAATVLARLQGAGFEVLDLHAALSTGFFEPPSEHLDARARVWLADRLAQWLAERLKAQPLAGKEGPDGHP